MNNTQQDEARSRHHAYERLPEIEKQRLKWQQRRWDPTLRMEALVIIKALAGAKFNSHELEETNQIYHGYFHNAAIGLGYCQIERGGHFEGDYVLDKNSTRVLKKRIGILEHSEEIALLEHDRLTKENVELHTHIARLRRTVARLKKATQSRRKTA